MQIDIPAYHASFKEFSIPEGYKAMWDRYKLWSLVAKAEEPALTDMLADIADLAPLLATGDDARFMNDLALRQQEN